MSAALPKTLAVLLVEDSVADGRLLLEALRPAVTAGELLVQTVKRLSQATEELQRFDYSCVLLDLGLPDGQGVDNVRMLRAVDDRPAIIVLTGLNDERVAVEALKLGAQDYLLKGETDAEQLLRLIRRAVQRNRQTVQLEHQRDSAYFAATREPLTQLPNLPLLLELARQQHAEQTTPQSLLLGVLALDGMESFRERAGVTMAEQWLREAGQAMSERLRPADTLACIAACGFVLLPRPVVDEATLQTLLTALSEGLQSLQLRRASPLRWRTALCRVQPGQQAIEQTLLAALASAQQAAPTPTSRAPQPAATPVASTAGAWLVCVDTQQGRCAGAVWAPGENPSLPAQLTAWAATRQALLGEAGAEPLSPILALQPSPEFWRQGRDAGVDALKAALAAQALSAQELSLVVPESALAAATDLLDGLKPLGVQFLLALEDGQWPGLALLARWPLRAVLLPAPYWQRVLDDNLRGPSRRALDALLGAAQALGASVIATGVDDANTRDALRLVGLRWMQGHALLAPRPSDALAAQWQQAVELPR